MTQSTVRALLALIRDQGLEPDDRLPPEAELTATLGVSRSVLREATSYLKGLGILDSRRGSGYRLRHLDPVTIFDQVLHQLSFVNTADLEELTLLRLTLEIGAIERAVRRATPADIAQIEALADELDALAAQPGCTVGAYNLLEADFHCAITRPAGVRLLNLLNQTIRDFFRRANDAPGASAKLPPQIHQNNREHRLIAIAFELRQPETALVVLRQHLAHEESRHERLAAPDA